MAGVAQTRMSAASSAVRRMPPEGSARADDRAEDGRDDQHRRRRLEPGRMAHSPRPRAITMRCTSFVPSPISSTFWSR